MLNYCFVFLDLLNWKNLFGATLWKQNVWVGEWAIGLMEQIFILCCIPLIQHSLYLFLVR